MPETAKPFPTLCAPVSAVPASVPLIPGTRVVACSGCRKKLYAAASTCKGIADGYLIPVCPACAPKGLPLAVTVEQAKEMVSWLGHDPAAN